MDYEKKYKEALERAREWYNNPNSSSVGKAYLYAVFPELKENEDEDERIRKALINFFDDANKCEENPMYEYGIPTDDIISWLEKQGKTAIETIKEENVDSANYVSVNELFSIGDWVIANG